ncbi:MAG TPA: serine/threonine-protein kinase, partial [Acidimicrobiales bacterium]|nr:serine/threonine-protein kinase [Acidimicrobiales bacterium]
MRLPGIEDLQEVGHGGFASVYRGWQPAFGRWVAVKVLHGAAPDGFQQEARAVGSLSEHPHVIPVYEAGHTDGRPYLVMPYLTGGSLQDRIRRGPLRPEEALATVQAVADAVSEAHRLGILHRDIKPANILFTGYGVPQLGDFGVARMADATMTGSFLAATVAYAAPEVLSGQRATTLSDVYSLGATLYAALRGASPFGARPGELPVAQAIRVVHDQAPSLEEVGVPGSVAALVARAMSKDPAERFGSAAEMRDALAGRDRAVAWGPPAGGEPVVAPTEPDAEPVVGPTEPDAEPVIGATEPRAEPVIGATESRPPAGGGP